MEDDNQNAAGALQAQFACEQGTGLESPIPGFANNHKITANSFNVGEFNTGNMVFTLQSI